MPTAIITGATGILGGAIVRELASKPAQWTKIYAMSRSKKGEVRSQVQHTALDLTASPDDMAAVLKDVEADYVFFSAYLEQNTEEENTQVNGDLLENFLKGLETTGAIKKIKRIILVTGAKIYGLHFGRIKIPARESDQWMPEPPYPPNFYYRQINILKSYCKSHDISWVITYPNDVLGFAQGNFMNFANAVALYASVHCELGGEKGQLPFPGAERFYTGVTMFTDAELHARFCSWAALEPRAGNEDFNVVNGDADSWQDLWPSLAKYFGLSVPKDQFEHLAPMASKTDLHPQVPISIEADKIGLSGRVSQSHLDQRIDLVRWAQDKEVQQAWERLAEREGLDTGAFSKASWAFAGFVLGRDYDIVLSMAKARKLGWEGYIDTWESFEKNFAQLKQARVIPR